VAKKTQCELHVSPAICTGPASSDANVNSTSLFHVATQQAVDLFYTGIVYRGTRWVLSEVGEVGDEASSSISVWTQNLGKFVMGLHRQHMVDLQVWMNRANKLHNQVH